MTRLLVVTFVTLFLVSCDDGGMDQAAQDTASTGTMDMTEVSDTSDTSTEVESDDVEKFLSGLNVGARMNIQRVVSAQGIEAWLVHESAVPVIAVEIGFKGGARRDPQGKEGLAYMLSGLLDEGAGDLDSQAFQLRLEELAIRLSFDAGRDGFYGSLRTLSDHRDEAFDLLKLALTQPLFDEEPVERIRSQILVSLNRDASQPRSIVQRKWYETVFAGHLYARPVKGTPESVNGITADDLRLYLTESLARQNMKIAVVGNISAQELEILLDRTFGSLPAEIEDKEIEQAEIKGQGQILIIERDQPQSIATFGGPGLLLDDPDFFAAYVMNYILGGGGFASRLTEEVREKRGLAYSVSTYLVPMDFAGLYQGSVATENSRIAQSLDIIRTEMARMRDAGVTEEELADAKTYLTGSFPLRFDSNSKIAHQLIGYQMTGRGIDYINTRNDKIEAVSLEEIARVAERLLAPEALTVIIVGQPEGIESNVPDDGVTP